MTLKKIFDKEILESKPAKEDIQILNKIVKDFSENLQRAVKKMKINAEIFVGGSFAKGTMLKKESYEVDIFLRFDKKLDNISQLTENVLKVFVRNYKTIHGSRDYFSIQAGENIIIEVIPVFKTSAKDKDVENVTDLSYAHVAYIRRELKKKKLIDDIILAKSFCAANHFYGAESYIQGFSGYGLELLILHYKGFEKMLKALSKANEQIVIFDKKYFKNRQEVMIMMNSAKLQSPIVLVDPTFKDRNALAALSWETFRKFQVQASLFIKNPSEKFFEEEKKDVDNIKKYAEKKGYEFVLLKAETGKQEGDIAGTKLLKFYRHLGKEISDYFDIKDQGFQYNKKQAARYYFVAKSKKEKLYKGPLAKDIKSVNAFKAKHKIYKIKQGRLYASEKIDYSIKEFVERWKKQYSKQMKEMSISGLKVV
jgi:tRNA nucleotidyltransferase (CCA-adding enzyme)